MASGHRGGDDKSHEYRERERSPGWSGDGGPGPGTRHVPTEQLGWGETMHPRYFLPYILPPEQYRAAGVSDKETEKRRNA